MTEHLNTGCSRFSVCKGLIKCYIIPLRCLKSLVFDQATNSKDNVLKFSTVLTVSTEGKKRPTFFWLRISCQVGTFPPLLIFVSFCCVHLLEYHWDNVNKTALFILVCIFKDHWHFSIEKELKIELHRHCSSKNRASYFRCASSHSSDGLHFKSTVSFLNWWICAGSRLSSGQKVQRVSELGLYKRFYKAPAFPAFMQPSLVFGEGNLHWRVLVGWLGRQTFVCILSLCFE